MNKTVSATNARIHFGEVLDEIERTGVRIIVERSGKPAAVLVPISDLEKLGQVKFDPEATIARVEALRARIAERRKGEPMPDSVEEIREMREERDAQLLGDMLRR